MIVPISFGEYKIDQANLKNYGDKGFSVGERSKFSLNKGNIFSQHELLQKMMRSQM